MFNALHLFVQPKTGPRAYRRQLGQGRTVSVAVLDNGFELEGLVLSFTRKIEKSDVVGGKLQSVALEETKRRGGKRVVHVALSYQAAEALELALKSALKDARQRRFWHKLLEWYHSLCTVMSESQPAIR